MLLDDVQKAHQVFVEEFTASAPCNLHPEVLYKDDLIKVLDLPRHSSMEDVFNYVKDLVEETKKLTTLINSFETKTK